MRPGSSPLGLSADRWPDPLFTQLCWRSFQPAWCVAGPQLGPRGRLGPGASFSVPCHPSRWLTTLGFLCRLQFFKFCDTLTAKSRKHVDGGEARKREIVNNYARWIVEHEVKKCPGWEKEGAVEKVSARPSISRATVHMLTDWCGAVRVDSASRTLRYDPSSCIIVCDFD